MPSKRKFIKDESSERSGKRRALWKPKAARKAVATVGRDLLSRPTLNCFPRTYRTKLRYYETTTLSPGASGVASEYIFRGNDLYDPNYTGVGHQPRGFDELIAFYDHFTVMNCTMSTTFSNGDNTYVNHGFVYWSFQNSALAAAMDVVERQGVIIKPLDSWKSGASIRTITMKVDIQKVSGRKDILSEDDFRGSASGSPSEVVYMHCGVVNLGGTDSGNIDVYTVLEYDVIFTEPKAVGSS